jgi:hypothetical protein
MLLRLAYCFREHAAPPGHSAPPACCSPGPGQCGLASPLGHDVASLPGHAAPPGHDAIPSPQACCSPMHATLPWECCSAKNRNLSCTHGLLFRYKEGFSNGRSLYIWPLISSHSFKNIFRYNNIRFHEYFFFSKISFITSHKGNFSALVHFSSFR